MAIISLSNAFFLTTFLSSIYPTYYYISTSTLPYYKLLSIYYNNDINISKDNVTMTTNQRFAIGALAQTHLSDSLGTSKEEQNKFLWSLPKDTYKPYNYYVYSIQKWCDNGYQIHGLWPQYDKNTYPTYCEAPIYQNVEGDLYNEMYKEWNNCGDLESFWNHEYTKHLSCIYQQYG